MIHLDKVQIHPTGIVDIKDPFNEKKWLCPEALRGCGGVITFFFVFNKISFS